MTWRGGATDSRNMALRIRRLIPTALACLAVFGLAGATFGQEASPLPTVEAIFPQAPPKEYSKLGAAGPYYPKAAADRRLSGEGLIECRLKADGKLDSCKPLSENPTRSDFAIAGVVMARRGWIVARLPDGVSTKAGSPVQVRVPFTADFGR